MTVRLKKNRMTPSLGQIEKRFEKLPRQAYEHWRKITPIRSGNAKRKTVLRGNTILARYPYAKRLDNGWSRQAPQGMFKPTLKYLDRIAKGNMRK